MNRLGSSKKPQLGAKSLEQDADGITESLESTNELSMNQEEALEVDETEIDQKTDDASLNRAKLIAELASLGTRVEELDNCSGVELENLLRGIKWLQRTMGLQQPDRSGVSFSGVDKKVLKSLITSNGRTSSLALSRQLDVPLTTVQRRRKRLESEFIEMYYVLKLEKLGWRRANLLISTEEGRTRMIGKELLTRSSISSVSTTIGEHTIDLLADAVFKDNAELLNIIEWVKSIEGVKQVVWTEAVERLGENNDKTLEIISGGKSDDST